MPSIRQLAGELSINMRTVVKAYDELVHVGLALRQQGRGVFITAPQGVLVRVLESQHRGGPDSSDGTETDR